MGWDRRVVGLYDAFALVCAEDEMPLLCRLDCCRLGVCGIFIAPHPRISPMDANFRALAGHNCLTRMQ